MEIRENDKICIISPLSSKLDEYCTARLEKTLFAEKRHVALDLSYVQDCTIDFINWLKRISKQKKLGMFNIPSDLFVLFNVMNLDKSIQLFVSEGDFEENARQLINRKFKVV